MNLPPVCPAESHADDTSEKLLLARFAEPTLNEYPLSSVGTPSRTAAGKEDACFASDPMAMRSGRTCCGSR